MLDYGTTGISDMDMMIMWDVMCIVVQVTAITQIPRMTLMAPIIPHKFAKSLQAPIWILMDWTTHPTMEIAKV